MHKLYTSISTSKKTVIFIYKCQSIFYLFQILKKGNSNKPAQVFIFVQKTINHIFDGKSTATEKAGQHPSFWILSGSLRLRMAHNSKK